MKYRYFLLFLTGILFGKAASAQLVGDNAFMAGQWLQSAIAPNGSWGNTMPVPAGYTTRTGSALLYPDPITGVDPAGNGLDFSYDQGHDGFAVGTPPWYGAYFLPGTPFDGWSVEIDDTMASAFYSNAEFGYPPFDTAEGGNFGGTVVGYAGPSCWSPHAASKGTWAGNYGLKRAGLRNALHIVTTNEVDSFASWLIVTAKFYNTSDSILRGVYYMATADPDNDQDIPGTFETNNHIAYQGGPLDRHEVWGRPPTAHQDAFSGLAAQDCRAKALIYSSWPPSMTPGNNLNQVWAETPTAMGSTFYTLGATTFNQDWAYGLVFKVGDIPPHDSSYITFAWIFSDTTAIDSFLNVQPQLSTLGNLYSVGGRRDSVIGCDLTGCNVSGPTVFDADIINGDTRNWGLASWTWSPAIGLSSTVGTHVTVNIGALTGPVIYTITGTPTATRGSCLPSAPVTFLLYVRPCFSASNNSIICVTDTLKLFAHGDSTGASYFWYGPGGYTAFIQNPYRTGMTMADTGWYTVVRYVGTSTDTSTTHVMLKPLPVIIASNNSPICSGPPNVLDLFSTPDSVGETFSWTGPNGFVSGLQNPTISSPPVSYSGTYKVKVVFNGCADSAYTTAIIDSTPAKPVVTNNSPLCSPRDATNGSTLLLGATDVTPGVAYSWSGPGGFSSFLQNPSYPLVPTAASGTYTVTVSITAFGVTCTNFNTTNVTIDSTPYLPTLSSNAPICSGQTLMLSATSSPFSIYQWDGPNGFSAAIQNPSIGGVTTAATGVYSVSATINYPGGLSCISDTAYLAVVVDSTPEVPTAGSNSPGPPSICERDTLFLTANDATAGVTYNWTGPNGFTSTNQNPYIANVASAATGQYTVTATLNGACAAYTVITVTITPTPTLIATNNGPICTGVMDTLFLEATSNPGATFSWTGPFVFLNNTQNPYRTPVIMEMAGVYQVTAFLDGCSSLPVNDTVVINQTPPPVWVKDTGFCQFLDAPRLQAFGDSVLWYAVGDANTPGTLLGPIPPTGRDTMMWFFVTQTKLNCRSALDSFSVTVRPKPVVTVGPSVRVCPHDSVILVATDNDVLITYHWSPSLYLDDTGNAIAITRPITNVTYEVVTTNQYGCHDTAYTSVTVDPAAVLFLGDSVTLYPGETYQLNPQTNCTSFAWFPAAGLNFSSISNPIASPEISTKYVVHGITNWGCKAVDSIYINVDPQTLLATPNAFAPGSGPNSEFKIIKRGIATLSYFRVFDRWGVMVFETTDIDKGWDGSYKGVPQPFGVYVYQISAVTSAGRNFEKHGNVTLVR